MLPAHRIAEDDTAPRIPERHAVEEAIGLAVEVLLHPASSAIAGSEDARQFSGARAHEPRGVRADRVDITELQRVGAWHATGNPGRAAVCRAGVRAGVP